MELDDCCLLGLKVPHKYISKTQQRCLFPEILTQLLKIIQTLSLAVLCKEACINSWMRGQLNKLTKLASITAQSRRTALIFTSCPLIHEEMHVSSCAVIRCSLKERSVERKWSNCPFKGERGIQD